MSQPQIWSSMVDGSPKGFESMGKVACIILARGGSKGIPRKNVLDFCGKPLVAWSIIQALGTPEIDEVYLSSDNDEILKVGEDFGAQLIRRPKEFATDTASSESAVVHALSTLDYKPEIVVMLEPTAPLRREKDLGKSIVQFRDEQWDSGFSGAVLEDFLIWTKDDTDRLISVNYDYENQTRRQDRKPDYVENGAIYLFKPEILDQNNRFGGNIGIYMMEFWQSFELDNPEDWMFVESLFKQYILEKK